MPCLFAMFAGLFPRLWDAAPLAGTPHHGQHCLQRQLALADPGHHLPALHHADVHHPDAGRRRPDRFGLDVADPGCAAGRNALFQHRPTPTATRSLATRPRLPRRRPHRHRPLRRCEFLEAFEK